MANPQGQTCTTSLGSSVSTKRHHPHLPKGIKFRTCQLIKGGQGWGLVLRGTTIELKGDLKVYTCYVEKATDNGEAQNQGIVRGDQITSIDDIQVKDLNHSRVVQIFQRKKKLKISIVPSDAQTPGQEVRVTRFNDHILPSIWALMNNLTSLEIIAVNISESGLFVGTLMGLLKLSLCHCSLSSLLPIRGLSMLRKLQSLSLAHNYLSDEAFPMTCDLTSLSSLENLDLSRNLLSIIPECLYQLNRLRVLIVVDNNMSSVSGNLSSLAALHTLCVDGNLIHNVDHIKKTLPSLCILSVSDNSLEYEPEILRSGLYSIASVQNNPFTKTGTNEYDSRSEPSLTRTLSIRGHLLSSKNI